VEFARNAEEAHQMWEAREAAEFARSADAEAEADAARDAMMEVQETSLVKIHPERDLQCIAYQKQAREILQYAEVRIVGNDIEVKDATNDLSIIRALKKGVEEKRQEWVKPLNGHVKAVNAAFKMLFDPLDQADKLTGDKILKYRAEVEMKRREAEAINQAKLDLARREAELSGTGEITVDITPVIVPEAQPDHIRAEMGTAGMVKNRKWEMINFADVPDDLKMLDSVKIGRLVRAGIGSIAGIRIYEEDSIRITR